MIKGRKEKTKERAVRYPTLKEGKGGEAGVGEGEGSEGEGKKRKEKRGKKKHLKEEERRREEIRKTCQVVYVRGKSILSYLLLKGTMGRKSQACQGPSR